MAGASPALHFDEEETPQLGFRGSVRVSAPSSTGLDHPTRTGSNMTSTRTPVWDTRVPSPESRRLSGGSRSSSPRSDDSAPATALDPSNRPGGTRSLSGISLRAFLLGVVLGLSSALAVYLSIASVVTTTTATAASRYHRLWRPAFFLSALALFHFLEYFTTAAYNPAAATTSSFLLTTNGRAYNAAHTAALLECTLTSVLAPSWQDALTSTATRAAGLALVVAGQAVRSAAMATAGPSFNHTVQTRRGAGHVLVTRGVYALLRHPSYWGFFWWGVGTQVVLGNKVCGLAYCGILWMFFSRRIRKEESLLVEFFGEAYVEYRGRTRVGIPFIA